MLDEGFSHLSILDLGRLAIHLKHGVPRQLANSAHFILFPSLPVVAEPAFPDLAVADLVAMSEYQTVGIGYVGMGLAVDDERIGNVQKLRHAQPLSASH
jgi:hypothetical protein